MARNAATVTPLKILDPPQRVIRDIKAKWWATIRRKSFLRTSIVTAMSCDQAHDVQSMKYNHTSFVTVWLARSRLEAENDKDQHICYKIVCKPTTIRPSPRTMVSDTKPQIQIKSHKCSNKVSTNFQKILSKPKSYCGLTLVLTSL